MLTTYCARPYSLCLMYKNRDSVWTRTKLLLSKFSILNPPSHFLCATSLWHVILLRSYETTILVLLIGIPSSVSTQTSSYATITLTIIYQQLLLFPVSAFLLTWNNMSKGLLDISLHLHVGKTP